MVQCVYFHIFILNTIVCSALLKLRLCKNLYSKTFINSEICVRFSSNQFVVALYHFQFFFSPGCGICVCALKRLEFSLRNLQLRFKLLRFWLRNSHLRFKLKNDGCGVCALTLKNFSCGICASSLKSFGCGICAGALN